MSGRVLIDDRGLGMAHAQAMQVLAAQGKTAEEWDELLAATASAVGARRQRRTAAENITVTPKSTAIASPAAAGQDETYRALFGDDGSIPPLAPLAVGPVDDDENYTALFGKDA